ncbi:metal ABC transporter permease [Rhizobiales bacterium]|uniref:metal ABC transporter permease n=1 Tax=Hongsoonwoonella zoysiae TaxID=2821844 RepID=UPI0015616458|nr:metal ABC transporter permease [Hongsoonwoonella zoysiae]NRG19669.1 metal ABC transporter permease [Hongsoonwoonella zoysiae]
MSAEIFLQFDFPSILLGSLAALCCGLLGNFLVLRRQSLMGDAISHVVLPGIVLGFLITGTLDSLPMMLGAGFAALVSVGLIELVRRLGKVEPGAAMGVVFTSMFAAGVLLLEQTGASGVHIDVEHALYGNLESAIWLEAAAWGDLLRPEILATLPVSVLRLVVVNMAVIAFILAFYKELKLVSFDPLFADTLGISSKLVGTLLIVMVAVAAVAAFDAVGSILVIAMFICPAATARLLTDRLSTQLVLSGVVAFSSGIIGYVFAAFGPVWLGHDMSVSAAGMIAVVAGLIQVVAMVFAPRYGVIARRRMQRA